MSLEKKKDRYFIQPSLSFCMSCSHIILLSNGLCIGCVFHPKGEVVLLARKGLMSVLSGTDAT